MDINTHFEVHDITNIKLHVKTLAVMCASNVLCDVISKGCELIDTSFGEFLVLFKEIQKNKEA